VFHEDFTGPDGSAPVGWDVQRSASGTGAGASIQSNTLALNVALAADQSTTQFVQARSGYQADWTKQPMSIRWEQATDAATGQTLGLTVAPTITTHNVVNETDLVRVRVQNGTITLTERAAAVSRDLWQGTIAKSSSFVDLELVFGQGSVELFAGTGAARRSLSGPLAVTGTWTTGWFYLHASAAQQPGYLAVFDSFTVVTA
jgi:hypothetical protein